VNDTKRDQRRGPGELERESNRIGIVGARIEEKKFLHEKP
jgi:hypothetical protein